MSTSDDPTLAVTLESVHLYPIKSCAGIAPKEALLIETGFDLDRAWMVVDTAGELVTQRELPRMALIRPTLKGDELVLRAPGMLALHLALDRVEAPCKATVWNDTVAAYDMGALAAQWFSDFLGQPLRLARFDPEQKRIADRRWTGEIEAETSFQDGFPFLVTSTAGPAERAVRRGRSRSCRPRGPGRPSSATPWQAPGCSASPRSGSIPGAPKPIAGSAGWRAFTSRTISDSCRAEPRRTMASFR